MDYEPYQPGPSVPEQPAAARPPAPGPAPAPPPMLYRSGTGSPNTTAGIAFVVVVIVVCVVAGLVAAGAGSGDNYDPATYASCAAEHDEDNSLFSDEAWCDLELEGGNGNGLADEGGDWGPVEQNSLFGDQDDPDDPFGDSFGSTP